MADVVIDADDAAALRRLFLDPVPSDDVVAAVSAHKAYPAQLLRLVLHPRNRDLTTCTFQTLHVLMDRPHDANGHAASTSTPCTRTRRNRRIFPTAACA